MNDKNPYFTVEEFRNDSEVKGWIEVIKFGDIKTAKKFCKLNLNEQHTILRIVQVHEVFKYDHRKEN